MKKTRMLVPLFVLLSLYAAAQGTSCNTPIALTLDGVIRTFTTSSTTGDNVVCASTGTSPVTFFSFTTNASGHCPLLSVAGPGGACEVAMYTACNGGNVLQISSSLCLNDGSGLWTPAHDYGLLSNTQYILRIKTAIAGTISIGSQHYLPSNDDCEGALPIGSASINDNNACHKGGPIVTPEQLCAFTLENTAFYVYTVKETGSSSIYISNINCDNGSAANSNGFQIGFFSGSCNALQYLNCSSGEGAAVIATTVSLPAGTKVYVAIDGNSGSNCRYSISTTNGEAMTVSIRNFSAWKESGSNLLRWKNRQEAAAAFYEVQRSTDGSTFTPIGKLQGTRASNKEEDYSFQDGQPPLQARYRLKVTDSYGQVSYSPVVAVSREDMPHLRVRFSNPVTHTLQLAVETHEREVFDFQLIDYRGVVQQQGKINCSKGVNVFYKDISRLQDGAYVVVLRNEKEEYKNKLVKQAGALYAK